MPESVRHEYFFSGRVQGVGFRYTVLQLVADLGITGFVQNLPDGRVHLLAEGSVGEIEQFMERIYQSRLGQGIAHRTVRCSPATGTYTSFQIRH